MADDTGGRRPRDATRFESFLSSLLEGDEGADAEAADPERTQVSMTLASLHRESTVPQLPHPTSAQPAPAHPPIAGPTTASGLVRAGTRRPSSTGRSARAQAGPPPFEAAAAIGLPNDHGLTSAGLVCEALAGFGLALAVIILAVVALGFGAIASVLPFGLDGMVVLALVLCILRSIAHGMLGRVLTRRDRSRMFKYVKAYFVVAVVQTVFLAAALGSEGLGALGSASGLVNLGALVVVSIAWPVVLLVMVLRPSNRKAFEIEDAFDLRVLPNDRGVAGAGTIMLVGGVLSAVALASTLVDGQSRFARTWVGVVVLLLLIARSGIHAYAGIIGMRRPSAAAFAEGVALYRIAAYVSGGAFVVLTVISSGAFEPLSIILVLGFTYLYFFLWPRRLTRFTHQVAAEIRADDVSKPLPQAPDGGLSALGYVLLWAACYNVANVVGLVFAATSGAALMAIIGFGQCALLFWAGLELARMTPRWRVAAWVYAGVTIALGLLWPLAFGAHLGGVALLSLALAIVTLVLVSRRLRVGASAGDMVRVFEG